MKRHVDLDDVPEDAVMDSLYSRTPKCRAVSPSLLVCSRSQGHAEPHVASGMTEALEAWTDER